MKLDRAFALRQTIQRSNVDCTVFGDDMSVIIDDDTVYGPDVTVQCGSAVDLDSPVVATPTILVEVLSPSTKGVDTARKLVCYFQLPSVSHYLMVDPDSRVVAHHFRSEDRIGTSISREGRVRLEPPDIEIDTNDVFSSLP